MVYTGQNREQYSWREYLLYGGITVGFLALIVVYVFEFSFMNRTLHFRSLALWSLCIGTAIGGTLGWWLGRDKADWVERLQIFVFFVVLLPLFSPLFASLSNRLLSFADVRTVRCEVVECNVFMADRFGRLEGEEPRVDGFYLFFRKEGALHRVELPAHWNPGVEVIPGSPLNLRFKPGLWGKEILLLNNASN
ncbi:MAG: hypothetical protein AAGH79_16515 [Bacteroidota bacterium]